jgi:hypothetical protein
MLEHDVKCKYVIAKNVPQHVRLVHQDFDPYP